MKTVVLFDPSIRSLNMGDHIIMKSAKDELKEIISDKFLIHCATHQPPVTCYQNTRLNPKIKIYDDAQFKFICGSNLLWKNLMIPRPTFNVNLFNTKIYENSILMGVVQIPPIKMLIYILALFIIGFYQKNFIIAYVMKEQKDLLKV